MMLAVVKQASVCASNEFRRHAICEGTVGPPCENQELNGFSDDPDDLSVFAIFRCAPKYSWSSTPFAPLRSLINLSVPPYEKERTEKSRARVPDVWHLVSEGTLSKSGR